MLVFDVPSKASSLNYNYWAVFCLDGSEGLKNLVSINTLNNSTPDASLCEDYFGTRNIYNIKPL